MKRSPGLLWLCPDPTALPWLVVAMLAHGFVERPTQDVDLFSADTGVVTSLTESLRATLDQAGFHVSTVTATETFGRLVVSDDSRRQLVVEIALDARMRSPVTMSFGRVLHPDELAADKVLALFGRGQARDLVDVAALLEHYSSARLLELASEKDHGFDEGVFAAALEAAAHRSDADFAETDTAATRRDTLREQARAWARDLRASR